LRFIIPNNYYKIRIFKELLNYVKIEIDTSSPSLA